MVEKKKYFAYNYSFIIYIRWMWLKGRSKAKMTFFIVIFLVVFIKKKKTCSV